MRQKISPVESTMKDYDLFSPDVSMEWHLIRATKIIEVSFFPALK
jgi:hypothetical protein